MDKQCVGLFPCIANAGGFAVGNGDGMDGIRVLVIEHENIVIALTGGDMETTCLVRIGL